MHLIWTKGTLVGLEVLRGLLIIPSPHPTHCNMKGTKEAWWVDSEELFTGHHLSVMVKRSLFYLLTSLISHLFPYSILNVSSFMTCGSVMPLFCMQVAHFLLLFVPGVYSSLEPCRTSVPFYVSSRWQSFPFMCLGRDISFRHAFHLTFLCPWGLHT